MTPAQKFWIRKDRVQYVLIGLIATCVIGSIVSSYWHFSDRLPIKTGVTLQQRKITKTQESRKLREAQFYAPKPRTGATQYYKLEEKSTLPKIPDLPEVNDEN